MHEHMWQHMWNRLSIQTALSVLPTTLLTFECMTCTPKTIMQNRFALLHSLLCFILCILTRRWLCSLEQAPPLLPVPNTHQLILYTKLNLSGAESCLTKLVVISAKSLLTDDQAHATPGICLCDADCAVTTHKNATNQGVKLTFQPASMAL